MINSDLFEPYDQLIEITIQGNVVAVPERNMLLRCFQYLAIEQISLGDFCWNGDCTNCQVWLRVEGAAGEREKPVLACRTRVEPGMQVTRLHSCIRIESHDAAQRGTDSD